MVFRSVHRGLTHSVALVTNQAETVRDEEAAITKQGFANVFADSMALLVIEFQ